MGIGKAVEREACLYIVSNNLQGLTGIRNGYILAWAAFLCNINLKSYVNNLIFSVNMAF